MATLVEEHADHAVNVPSTGSAHPQILARSVARAIVGVFENSPAAQIPSPFRRFAFEMRVPRKVRHAQAATFGIVQSENTRSYVRSLADRVICFANWLTARANRALACEERRCRGNSKCERAGQSSANPYPSHGPHVARVRLRFAERL